MGRSDGAGRVEEEIEEAQIRELQRGLVQETGCVVVVSPGLLEVQQVSENLEVFFGVRPEKALGRSLEALLGHDSFDQLQRALAKDAKDLAELLPIAVQRADGRGGLACIPSQPEEEYWVLEFEPLVLGDGAAAALLPPGMRAVPCVNPSSVRRAVEELHELEESETGLFAAVCETFSRLLEFDRVMCYKFARDWHGEVVGEALRPGVHPPFLGLNFPATDVPPFFRQSFFKHRVRHVSSTNGREYAVIPSTNPDTGGPVDLMPCGLRAPTKCSRDYYNNMGSHAQLTFAVTVRRKLWGTISCHHGAPAFVTYATRAALLPIVAALGKTVERMQLERQRATEARIRALTTAMYGRAANQPESFLQSLVGEDVAPLASSAPASASAATPRRLRSLPAIGLALDSLASSQGSDSGAGADSSSAGGDREREREREREAPGGSAGSPLLRSLSVSGSLAPPAATPLRKRSIARSESGSGGGRTPHLEGEMPRPARRRPLGIEVDADPSMLQIVQCCGVCVVYDGEKVCGGVVPPLADIEAICAILDNPVCLALIAADLSREGEWEGEGDDAEFVCWAAESAQRSLAEVSPGVKLEWSGGLLVLLLDEGYAMWFREARTALVRWAGCGAYSVNDEGGYGPRASFDQWKEEVGDQCEPWSEEDEVAAKAFRAAIADALRLIGTLRRLREIERRSVAARPDADFSTPADRLVSALSVMAGKPGVSEEEKRALEACLTLLTSQQNLYTPDLAGQVQAGKLRLDRDTRRWLFSEIAPQGSSRALDTVSTMSTRSMSRTNSFSGSHPSSETEADSPRPCGAPRPDPGAPAPHAALATQPPLQPRSPLVSGIVIDSSELEERRDALFTLLDSESLELACVRGTLSSWDDFDIFTVAKGPALGRPLCATAWMVLEQHGLVAAFALDPHRLQAWLWCIEDGYRSNPYHNNIHASDVTQSIAWLLTRGALAPHLTDLEKLALVIAAVIHDFEHPGFNNGFQVATATELALLYNDRAPLENHHVSAAWRRLRMPQHNFLASMNPAQVRELRKLVVDIVLATDMSQHFEGLGVFKKRAAVGFVAEGAQGPSSPPPLSDSKRASICHRSSIAAPTNAMAGRLPLAEKLSADDRRILACTALKVADIGHAAKPLPLHVDWSTRICNEFFAQGDRERDLGIPVSPFMCRKTTVMPRSQSGFFEFVAFPLFQAWASVFPAAEETLLPHLQRNYQHWQSLPVDPEPASAVQITKDSPRAPASPRAPRSPA
eukprot:tig00021582_g22642.t1